MKFETPDLSHLNIEKLGELFPNCITEKKDEEGRIIKAVNYEAFRQMFSKELVEEGDESYEFTWVGKRESIIEANKPIRKTLRPCLEESKDWDNTENLYIEGDNLDVIKTLQESYLNSVKMIYIDPPYNTGNDFIYNDGFIMEDKEYSEEIGEFDEEGNRLFKNTDSNGRFHSDWCSMIYPRLVLARNLLSDDGVIFISIDDNEQDNLKKICDEVFGKENFVGEIIRKTRSMVGDNSAGLNIQHEYLVIYSRDINKARLIGEEKDFKNYANPDKDKNGDWCIGDPSAKSGGDKTYFEIINPYTNKIDLPPKGRYWAFSKETMDNYINEGRIKFKKTHKDNERGFIFKRYKKNLDSIYNPLSTIFGIDNIYMNQNGKKDIEKVGMENIFSYPKPIRYIYNLVASINDKNSIILDFFSGSATTAHAVMELNAEDGGNRKFIMVQLPEETDEKSEAYKAGYKNICEIGKERIRRAGEKIKEDNKDKEGIEDLDTGFRVLKLDDTNMKDIYYAPEEYEQNLLDRFESNIKEDRDDLDLLFGCLIDWGLPLDRPYESMDIAGVRVHVYNHGDLVACFDEDISEEAVKEIAKMEPLRVVFRDSSFADESKKTNVKEIFKLLSADTSVKVI